MNLKSMDVMGVTPLELVDVNKPGVKREVGNKINMATQRQLQRICE